MNNILARAEARQRIAEHILRELDLIERWRQFGTPHLVGAVACRLVVAPDIDMEIVSSDVGIEGGFDILRACAQHPNVTKTRFSNELGPPHFGLYWQVRYVHEDEEWKIDMWQMADSYDGPCGAQLTGPMNDALTDEFREIILRLKEGVRDDPSMECPSIQIYRAVLDCGVRTLEELKDWLPGNPLTGVVTDWRPGEQA